VSRVAVVVAALVGLMVLSPGAGRASLHQPDEPRLSLPSVMMKVAGDREVVVGQELPFDVFELQLVGLINQLNPNLKNAQGKNPDRDPVIARIEARRHSPNRSPEDTAALAADLLRTGKPDEAEALLVRDRQGFLPNVTLAHIYAAKGDWHRAYDYLVIANGEDPPAALKGLTAAQLDWQMKINRGPLTRLYKARALESQPGRRPNPQTEDVDPVFPVRFVNDAGKYEPGNLAAAERAKLPADAVAVVQQMMLWSPTDSRLYWLLAELYAVAGRFEEARKILDVCVSEARQYGNRRVLRDHRAAIQPLAEEQAKKRTPEAPILDANAGPTDPAPPVIGGDDPPPENPPPAPIGIGAVWVYFGLVAVIALLAAVRVVTRRTKGNGGPFR
jgi:hypothetical protein